MRGPSTGVTHLLNKSTKLLLPQKETKMPVTAIKMPESLPLTPDECVEQWELRASELARLINLNPNQNYQDHCKALGISLYDFVGLFLVTMSSYIVNLSLDYFMDH
jgi:hypothetical protein